MPENGRKYCAGINLEKLPGGEIYRLQPPDSKTTFMTTFTFKARRSQTLHLRPPNLRRPLLTELGWTAEAVAQMPREVHHPSPSELLLSLRDDKPKPPRASSLLLAITQVGQTLSYHFLEPKFGSTPRLATYFSSASRLTFGSVPPPKPSRR